jgi:hypothetical protein
MKRAPAMRRQLLVPSLYQALFEISCMRDDISALQAEVSEAEAARLMSRIEWAERAASRLLDQVESRRNVAGH